MTNLLDRIQEFMMWLESETDFGMWDKSVKDEVHRMLIWYLISEKVE